MADGPPSGDAQDAYDYYLSTGDLAVQRNFLSLDNPANLDLLMNKVQHHASINFITDFSDNAAWAAFDLPSTSFEALFGVERPHCLNTRWLNIWRPFQHRSLLQLLAKRYDFSPRLLALMCSDPKLQRASSSRSTLAEPKRKRLWSRSAPISEEEKDTGSELDEISEHSSISSMDSVVRGNLYTIADSLWHYSSIDFGRQYVCIGFNSLYGHKPRSISNEDVTDNPLPHCTRVWTWLILCEDHTVISINEDPFPFVTNGSYSSLQLRILTETRRNLTNVLRSLSTVDTNLFTSHNALTLLPFRTRLGNTPEETAHRNSDQPGLLFYYLFENWHNSYTLLTRKESRYGLELSALKKEMFAQPKLHHVDRLDRIGNELGVLRRHYQSYDRIIARLLEPQTSTAASLHNSHVVEGSHVSLERSVETVRGGPVVTAKESLMGVSLSSAARVRFVRLRDLMGMYARDEVEEYLKQKEALIAMNFNLIAIKQSVDVDRLTRITLLLTKATILFLPISLMTGYFSMQLGVDYSVRTYWISFVVCFFLSWLALFLFGLFHGSVQTIEALKSMWSGIKWLTNSQ